MKRILLLVSFLSIMTSCRVEPQIGDLVEVCPKNYRSFDCYEGTLLHITEDNITINSKIYSRELVRLRILERYD